MNKWLLVMFLLGAVILQAPAKTPALDEVKNAVDAKAALSVLKMGDYLFTLKSEKQGKYLSKVYTYYPKQGPATFTEVVDVNIHTGVQTIIGKATGLIGPLSWRYEDYQISSIEIIIYPRSVLNAIQYRWWELYGDDSSWGNTDYIYLSDRPVAAFVTKGGHTIEVRASAFSKEHPYRRKKGAHSPLYSQFTKMAKTLQKDLTR